MKTNAEWIKEWDFREEYTPNEYEAFFKRHMSFDESERPTHREYMDIIINYHYALRRALKRIEELESNAVPF